jgi:hypothetical protein
LEIAVDESVNEGYSFVGSRAESNWKGITLMANFGALITDLPAEATAVGAFVNGIEKLVTDAKASGLSTVAISDIEALGPEGEAVVQDTEKIIGDL